MGGYFLGRVKWGQRMVHGFLLLLISWLLRLIQLDDGIGHFFGAMRVDAFRPADEFKKHMDNWITRFRSAKTVEGQSHLVIPGDPEREVRRID
ncbi:MAG: Ldh family oxidoreductase [Cytophagales bacterium]|nr:Ldh family oxidoreductase [Cytophagales bacterium]